MGVRGVAVPLSVALLLGLPAGCGSGNDTISSSTAGDLHRQVDALRKAAADGRDPDALSAAADLRTTIRRLTSSGELDPADGMVLLTQVDRVATRIENRATPTPVPTVLVPVDGNGNGNGNGNGYGNGYGHGNGHGNGKAEGND